MMVAIAVFSIVMTVAMGALVNVIDANQKAQTIKTAINNVNFALESISKDMRVGTDYVCLDADLNQVENCLTGVVGIKYKTPRSPSSGSRLDAYYYYNQAEQSIESCLQKESTDCETLNEFSRITSPEVAITNMKFYLTGTATGSQPYIIITLSGLAGTSSKQKTQTAFDLQTSISQRARILTTN